MKKRTFRNLKRWKTRGQSLNPENGGVAQLGEHLPCTQGVRSSILLISTKSEKRRQRIEVRNNESRNFKALTKGKKRKKPNGEGKEI